MTARHPNAAQRLAALLHGRVRDAFAWGGRDCCDLAFDCAHAVSGRDRFADLRGTYSGSRAAARILRGLGGLHGLCAARLGPAIALADAADGDVVLLRPGVCTAGTSPALGVVYGAALLGQGGDGIVVVPRAMALRVWSAC